MRLNLSHNSLSGGLPLQQVMPSSSIVAVDISFNRLEGELHRLPSPTPLQVLNISSNLFTGEFPSGAWSAMNNLVVLNASNNSFTGRVPSSFCLASASFAVLDLQYNRFSGNVPPELGNCSMLKVLNLGHNNLLGTIPDELFNATSLERLSFRNTGLQGTLDRAKVAKLRDLSYLDLGENGFSGELPDSIGQLKRLQELYLDYNSMSGELPPSLNNCTNLISINLKSNNFVGEASNVDFAKLLNLEHLDLATNGFTGTIPESIYSRTNLKALRVSNNNFYGQLSPRIGSLRYLTFLSLANNSFTNISNSLHIVMSHNNLRVLFIGMNFIHEAMPQNVRNYGLDTLQALDISGCSLTGEIPLWLSSFRNLEILSLSNNQLNGQIPGWINHLDHLLVLDVSNNSITGDIQTALLDMKMLKSVGNAANSDQISFALPIYWGKSHQYHKGNAFPKALDLSNNNLTGRIPQEIGQLEALNSLNLSYNRFYGEIPRSLCNLRNLQLLDLSSNSLTGTIPDTLNNLHILSMFNISNNDLEGPVPTGGQLSTFPESSYNHNPKLCGSVLIRRCNPVDTAPDAIIIAKDWSNKIIFATAFVVSFGLGVLYDHLVVSKFVLYSCIQL
jgi:Leucine-rich repeat (LRR) protein